MGIHNDVSEILYTEEKLAQIVKDMGNRISEDYRDKNLFMVSVLKGSLIFMADLMRAIDIPCAIDFLSVSSYGAGTTTSGAVRILKDLDCSLEGKDVLVVEDILDSGVTLSYLLKTLPHASRAASGCVRCSISPNAVVCRLPRTTSAPWFRMNSSWATVWIMRKNTATCRISVCSSRKFILNKGGSSSHIQKEE